MKITYLFSIIFTFLSYHIIYTPYIGDVLVLPFRFLVSSEQLLRVQRSRRCSRRPCAGRYKVSGVDIVLLETLCVSVATRGQSTLSGLC